MINNYSVLVIGCKKHEEIADRFFKLSNIFWPEMLESVIFCTDQITPFQELFPTTAVVEELNNNYKERIKKGLSTVKTDYVLLMLDDYYLTKRIDNKAFVSLISDLRKNDVSYCKLIGLPKCFKKYPFIKGMHSIKKTTHYGISLQPSIWKTDSLEKALEMCKGCSAWEVEAAFSSFQAEHFTKCLVYNKNYLSIKNGVLRGQLFPYTNKILKKNELQPLELERISWFRYLFFSARQHLAMHLPIWVRKTGKRVGKKLGKKYYSED